MKAKSMTTSRLRNMKRDNIPISVVTAYDYPTARLAEQAGVDVILVGDSLGNVVLGYESTIPVTLQDMIHHSRAVARGAAIPLIVTDMPFMTYHGSIDSTLANAAKLMQEGMCKAVKLEGGQAIAPAVQALTTAGIPVMGHLGFTPQSLYQIGGYKVQGKSSAQADQMLADAVALEKAGAFAIVLEMVTTDLAQWISSKLTIPTIGIGAGVGCDGQVLVFHDIVNFAAEEHPKKFVKSYADIGSQIRDAFTAYVKDVKLRQFPTKAHSFESDREVIEFIYGENKV